MYHADYCITDEFFSRINQCIFHKNNKWNTCVCNKQDTRTEFVDSLQSFTTKAHPSVFWTRCWRVWHLLTGNPSARTPSGNQSTLWHQWQLFRKVGILYRYWVWQWWGCQVGCMPPLAVLGSFFCLLLGVSSGCARPITGQVTEVTCPVIGLC